MSTPSLVVPRYEIGVVDKNGNMSREWYKFFALIAKSIGPSLTNSDDLQATQNVDAAAIESIANQALNAVKSQLLLLMAPEDQPKPQDNLMAWWPGDAK
jgi:hypothetical protein